MALQIRRGPNSLRTTITPEPGEPLWTTDTNILYVGDGVTAGGIAISAVINTATSSVVGGVKIGSGVDISADGTISVNTGGGFTADQSLNTNSNVVFNQIVVGSGSSVGNIYSKGAQNLLLSADDSSSVGGRVNILSGESNGVVIGNHNTTQILSVNTASGVVVSSPFAIKSDYYQGTNNNNNIFFGDGANTVFLRPRSTQNLRITPFDGVGGYFEVQQGEAQGLVLGNHYTNSIMTINTATGVNIANAVFNASTASFGGTLAATALANVTTTNVLYYNSGNGQITYGPTPAGGGSSYDQSLNTTDKVQFVSVSATNTLTVQNLVIDSGGGTEPGSIGYRIFTRDPSSGGSTDDLQFNSWRYVFLNPSNGVIINEFTTASSTIKVDTLLPIHLQTYVKVNGGFSIATTASAQVYQGLPASPNNLYFGDGTAQAIVSASGQQTLQLSANGETGNGAKIFLGSGESGTVQLGHYNNNNIMNISTASGVQANAMISANAGITISGVTTATGNIIVAASNKLITTATTYNQNIEIWNSSGTNTDHSTLRFYRQRGSAAPQANAVLGAIQVDGWQTTNGYASAYAANRRFPGISIEAAANFGADTAPTQFRVLNRGAFIASNPFPYNQTAQNTTDTTVVESLFIGQTTSRLKASNFIIYDPLQGWDILNGAGASSRAVFGSSAFSASIEGAGNALLLRPQTAYSTTTNEYPQSAGMGITLRNRTDHIAYWNQTVGGLNTSTQGQINWVSAASTANWVSPSIGSSVVKGANIALNSTRYQRGAFNIARGTASTSTSYLWNTSTQAGDVLGTISFQGGLSGSAIANQLDGAVDGILIRAYAVNNWEGEQSSTTTDVTYSLNESAIRIEHATTTTIGGASASAAGLQQKYSTLVEFGKTTSTFYTDIDAQKPVTAAELTVNSATITVNNIAVGFTATGITLNGTEFTGSGGTPYAITRQEVSGNTTLSTSTALFVLATGAGGYTVTLPQTTGVTGVQEIRIKNKTTGTLTIATSNSELIDDDATLILEQPNSSVILTSNTSSWAIF